MSQLVYNLVFCVPESEAPTGCENLLGAKSTKRKPTLREALIVAELAEELNDQHPELRELPQRSQDFGAERLRHVRRRPRSWAPKVDREVLAKRCRISTCSKGGIVPQLNNELIEEQAERDSGLYGHSPNLKKPTALGSYHLFVQILQT